MKKAKKRGRVRLFSLSHVSRKMTNEEDRLRIAEALHEAAASLGADGVPEARREASSLLAHASGRDRTFLITHPEQLLTEAELSRFRAMVARRARGEPLQYITGLQEFYGLEFEVTEDVLIPRPETELLVEAALDLIEKTEDEPQQVCDVGTGSGCIAITLLHERASLRGTGVDVSQRALEVARRNAVRHKVAERLTLIASDCLTALDAGRTRFGMIVSNPPYVAEESLRDLQREVRDYEPRSALTPGGDGLGVIRRLLLEAPPFLPAGGHLLFEMGFDQRAAVEGLLDEHVWTLLEIHKDLQGIPRIVALRKK